MVETLAMRTMSKAVYSTENIGHYGLAFSHIRILHRPFVDIRIWLLTDFAALFRWKISKCAEYEEMMKHCSAQERLAADAERDSIKFMQVKFMEKHVGEVFEGVISGQQISDSG
jgi:ribonuclease R